VTSSPSTLPKPTLFSQLVTGRAIRIYCLLTLAVLAAIIFWQNWAEVETPVLFMTVNMPRSLFMTLVLAIGFLLGLLTRATWWRDVLGR
jgi:hypothetical protein